MPPPTPSPMRRPWSTLRSILAEWCSPAPLPRQLHSARRVVPGTWTVLRTGLPRRSATTVHVPGAEPFEARRALHPEEELALAAGAGTLARRGRTDGAPLHPERLHRRFQVDLESRRARGGSEHHLRRRQAHEPHPAGLGVGRRAVVTRERLPPTAPSASVVQAYVLGPASCTDRPRAGAPSGPNTRTRTAVSAAEDDVRRRSEQHLGAPRQVLPTAAWTNSGVPGGGGSPMESSKAPPGPERVVS